MYIRKGELLLFVLNDALYSFISPGDSALAMKERRAVEKIREVVGCQVAGWQDRTARHASASKFLTLLWTNTPTYVIFPMSYSYVFRCFSIKNKDFSKIRNFHGREPTKTQIFLYSNVKFIDDTPPKKTEMCLMFVHFLHFRHIFRRFRRDFLSIWQDGKMAGQDGPPNVRGGLAVVSSKRMLAQ